MKIFTRSHRDLSENRGEIAARSRRDRGAFLAAEISPSRRDHGRDRGEITARSGNLGGQKLGDLAAILAEMREISAARSRRDSRRDRRDMEISAGKYAARCCSEIAARSEISAAKTRRNREVISRRDMDISAGSFAARPRWESCRDLRRETKFLAVKIVLLSHREAKFSAAKLGSMRTIFTFTLTINQTTRR